MGRTDLPNSIIESLVRIIKRDFKAIDDINEGKPLGMEPKSTKQQIDEWLNMTEQDHIEELQKVGYEKYIEHTMDMEKKIEKSNQGIRNYHGIMEGV